MTMDDPIDAPGARSDRFGRAALLGLGIAMFPVLYYARRYRFETFRDLSNIFSIVAAGAVFVVAWKSRYFLQNNYLLVVGIAYVFIALLGIGHLAAEADSPNENDVRSRFRMAGDLIEAATLVAAPLLLRMRRRLCPNTVCLIYLAAAGGMLLAFQRPGLLPPLYAHHALTPFALGLSAFICLAQPVGIALLWRRRSAFPPGVLRLLMVWLALTEAHDICLSLSADPMGWPSLSGHYLVIVGLYPLYLAFVEIGLVHPLRRLRESEHRYHTLFDLAPVGLCIASWNGQVTSVNQRLRDLLALGDAAAEKLDMKNYIQEDLLRPLLLELQERGRAADWPMNLRRTDGQSVPVLANVEWVRLDGREQLMWTLADQTQRRRLEAEVLSIGEAQSRRIGQDLHDTLGQNLTSTAFLAGVLTRKLDGRRLPEAADAGRIEAMLAESIDLTRVLSRGLSPVGLHGECLQTCLKDLAAKTRETFPVDCHVQCGPGSRVRDSVQATHLYRIAQEAVTNAVKHARAANIWIELSRRGEGLALAVRDDGQGLTRRDGDGLGLRIMQYRANSIGGLLEVRRLDEGGTEVRCTLPKAAWPGEHDD